MIENKQPVTVIRYSWKRSALFSGLFLVLSVLSYLGLFTQSEQIRSGEILALLVLPVIFFYNLNRLVDRKPVYILYEDRIQMTREDNKALLFSKINYYELDRVRYNRSGAFMRDYINFYDDRNMFRFRIRIDNMDIDETWLLSFLDKCLEKYEFLKGTYRKRG